MIEKQIGCGYNATMDRSTKERPPIGAYLRKLRLERGFTLQQVAIKTGVKKAYVEHLESGIRRPKPETLAKFARAYNVPVERLMAISLDLGEANDGAMSAAGLPTEISPDIAELLKDVPETQRAAVLKAIEALTILAYEHRLDLEANLMQARLEAELGKPMAQVREELLAEKRRQEGAEIPRIGNDGNGGGNGTNGETEAGA